MAGMMFKILCSMIVGMMVAAPYAEAALSCNEVIIKLAPCLGYLMTGGKVPIRCCKGVKGLKAVAKTVSDRKRACECLKTAYKSHPGIKPANGEILPRKCGVSVPYKISPKTDCNKVK
uniref:non-specific lipid-transfer protein Lac s 1-like n=1 Tax=Erigeron canadensis TaxID=72917 RepID=UPI001CB95919|nr:non-specific lipid-transfer protein Lac s 1-like [Erigeron canadensis]